MGVVWIRMASCRMDFNGLNWLSGYVGMSSKFLRCHEMSQHVSTLLEDWDSLIENDFGN
jgi:hypothetical protein